MPPHITKGRFINIIQKYSGQPVICTISMEIPVTPPSIKLFGIRNDSKPNEADITPIMINKRLFMFLNIFCLGVVLCIVLWFYYYDKDNALL